MNRFGAKTFCLIFVSFGLILLSLSCGNSETKSGVAFENSKPEPTATTTAEKPQLPEFIDVPGLANKSSVQFDSVFGKPSEVTKIEDNPKLMPGEYRLYNVKGHPKGLSVRFFRDRAKRFNLLLGKPAKSSKDIIFDVFRVNVGNLKPDKLSEPLSEKWKGKFNGVDFVTIYAKREKFGGDFTMVHAEIGN